MKCTNLKTFGLIYSLIIGGVLFVSMPHSLNAKQAKNCATSYKIGKASDKNKFNAGRSAVQKWQKITRSILGTNWTSWQNAQLKTIPCHFNKQSGTWQCRAIARPCRL